jgi:hypothetical protein
LPGAVTLVRNYVQLHFDGPVDGEQMRDPLLDSFRAKAFLRGGLLMFAPDDAVELIKAAERTGRKVLGIDGFLLTEHVTQPSLENSVDFSAEAGRRANVNQRALRFIRERAHQGLHFEIVLEPPLA